MLALLQGVSGTLPAADASGTVIAVILPDSPDASMLEALSRLRGEADSVGLELRLVQAEAGADTARQLRQVADRLTPAAVVALVASPTVDPAAAPPAEAALRAMDVWFLDPATGATSVGHLIVEPEAGPRADLVLAVRVVDFIRARMFDSLVRSRATAKAKRAPVDHTPQGRRYLAAGLTATGSWSGFGAAFLPTLEVGYAWRPWLRTAVGVAGWGSTPRRQSAEVGGVALDQTMLKASVAFLGRAWWRLQPAFEVGGTAYFVSVDGVGYSGYVGDAPSGWSPGLHGAAGLGLILSRHLVAQLGVGALVLARRPRVYVTETEVASTGRPAWTAQASLGAAF